MPTLQHTQQRQSNRQSATRLPSMKAIAQIRSRSSTGLSKYPSCFPATAAEAAAIIFFLKCAVVLATSFPFMDNVTNAGIAANTSSVSSEARRLFDKSNVLMDAQSRRWEISVRWLEDTFNVCKAVQHANPDNWVRRLQDKSRMTNCCRLSNPSICVSRFLLRYKHRNSVSASRPSIC